MHAHIRDVTEYEYVTQNEKITCFKTDKQETHYSLFLRMLARKLETSGVLLD